MRLAKAVEDEMLVNEDPRALVGGLTMVEDLPETIGQEPAMNWVRVMAEWALQNLANYHVQPKEEWYFRLPDDPTKMQAYRVAELGPVGMQFDVTMGPPGWDRENGHFVCVFRIHLLPAELNDRGEKMDNKDPTQVPYGSTRQMATVDILDEAGVVRRQTIPRFVVRPLLNEAMTNSLLNRCAQMFMSEIRRRCETSGVQFQAEGIPVPAVSGELQNAAKEHGEFRMYVR